MEYEYAIAIKLNGYWARIYCHYDSYRLVKDEYDKLVRDSPEEIFCIVRRPKDGWEFVDEESADEN